LLSSRTAAKVSWSQCGLTMVLITCVIVLAILNHIDVRGLSSSVGVLSSAVVGAVVASRRPSNPIGWFFLGSALCFALQEFTLEYAVYGLLTRPGTLPLAQVMVWLQSWIYVPGVMLLLCLLPLYFPDGRLISRHWRWVVRVASFFFTIMAVNFAFLPGEVKDLGLVNPLGIEALRPVLVPLGTVVLVSYFAILFVSVASLVVRFKRSADEERQQIKWLAYAASAIPLWFLISLPVQAVVNTVLYEMVDSLVFAGVPVAAGIAILRYRLYDIDVIINRTLVYGALTASLAVVYFVSVVLLQRIFVTLTGQGSQLAVVASTLAIAALFNPLRRRVQAFIDRRFYRRKYDVVKTLEAFSARLRDEVELDALSEDLVEVVRETMQPAHVSLWLRPPGLAGRGAKGGEGR
jgi:hypothetical protein